MDKTTLSSLIGPFPQKVKMNSEIVLSENCGSYTREKVIIDTEENDKITAYLLIPKGLTKSCPVAFCHHQHANNFKIGKSEVVGIEGDPDQAIGVELVNRGYIVYAPDSIAFEDRNWTVDKSGKAEYYELATRIVNGKTLMSKVLHDVIVGIDYLVSRNEVDSKNIGFIGHSYGGRMAIWSPVFDNRIKVSVSNCGCVNYKDSINHEAGIQMEFCIPNILKHGDIEDIVKLVSPTPLFISATDDDKWSKGAEYIYDYAKSTFANSELKLKVWEGKHIFTKEMRSEAYLFLDKYLKN